MSTQRNPQHALKDPSNNQTEKNSPAPSPLAGQHPTPPLWLILTNISFASMTTLREAIDLSEATMPTPQFSLSWLASYKVAGRRVAAAAKVVEGARAERDWLRRCLRIFSVVYHDLDAA
jgi:hypothetical protein